METWAEMALEESSQLDVLLSHVSCNDSSRQVKEEIQHTLEVCGLADAVSMRQFQMLKVVDLLFNGKFINIDMSII